MDPLVLTAGALREPWRLWTAHLIHFGWEHTLANTVALALPFLLAPRGERGRLAGAALLLAPLLGLFLLPVLGEGTYRGASGLACALWAYQGLRGVVRRADPPALLLLGGLALKLAAEAALGIPVLRASGWQPLPTAHLGGALLGLAAALPWRLPAAARRRPARG